MITKKQSIREAKKRTRKQIEREIDEVVERLTNGVNADKLLKVDKIDPRIAPDLEAFLNHKPYLPLFQDIAYVASGKDEKWLKAEKVDDLIPFLFTAVDNQASFIATELVALFTMYRGAKNVLEVSAETGMEIAEAVMNPIDLNEIHHMINVFTSEVDEMVKQEKETSNENMEDKDNDG